MCRSFYCRFFVEVGQFNQLHLGSHFFHLLTPPRFGALNLAEVNQFTGNSFRVVRIVLKITFLKLRYPKGVTGRLLPPSVLLWLLSLIMDPRSSYSTSMTSARKEMPLIKLKILPLYHTNNKLGCVFTSATRVRSAPSRGDGGLVEGLQL